MEFDVCIRLGKRGVLYCCSLFRLKAIAHFYFLIFIASFVNIHQGNVSPTNHLAHTENAFTCTPQFPSLKNALDFILRGTHLLCFFCIVFVLPRCICQRASARLLFAIFLYFYSTRHLRSRLYSLTSHEEYNKYMTVRRVKVLPAFLVYTTTNCVVGFRASPPSRYYVQSPPRSFTSCSFFQVSLGRESLIFIILRIGSTFLLQVFPYIVNAHGMTTIGYNNIVDIDTVLFRQSECVEGAVGKRRRWM